MPQFTQSLAEHECGWCTSEDRRAGPRHPANGLAVCQVLTGDNSPAWTVPVRELSRYGIGLVLPKAQGCGRLLAIELARPYGMSPRMLTARLVHERRESRQVILAGCAFIKELEDQHLGFFRAEAAHFSGLDCRRWTRFPCSVETACYSCDAAPGERRSGRIVNISAGGVALMLRCQFLRGTLLHFELPQEMNLADPMILVRVVRAQDQGEGNWFLGCEFADQLSEDEVHHLRADTAVCRWTRRRASLSLGER